MVNGVRLRTAGDIGDEFFHELHKRVGVCGHCGKRDCPGRVKMSILPSTIPKDDILAAMETVVEG